jgi:hypothetical protein
MVQFHPDALRHLLAITRPDVLAVEARPEDMVADHIGDAPADIVHIVIPWAQARGIAVRPIDWWLPGERQKGEAMILELGNTEVGQKRLASVPDEMAIHSDVFVDPAQMTVAYVESEAFAHKDHAMRTKMTEVLGEGPMNLWWQTRAQKMQQRLEAVIREFPGRRIVVVTGAAHRGDFERALSQRSDVRLIKVHTLAGLSDAVPYTGGYGRAQADARRTPDALTGLL